MRDGSYAFSTIISDAVLPHNRACFFVRRKMRAGPFVLSFIWYTRGVSSRCQNSTPCTKIGVHSWRVLGVSQCAAIVLGGATSRYSDPNTSQTTATYVVADPVARKAFESELFLRQRVFGECVLRRSTIVSCHVLCWAPRGSDLIACVLVWQRILVLRRITRRP